MSNKKIFLTTLSILPKNNNASYYWTEDSNGNRQYCLGYFSNEPGAKYILSTQELDKIIIVGSNSTYSNQNSSECLFENVTSLNDFQTQKYKNYLSDNKFSKHALSFFLYRLSEFFKNKENYSTSIIKSIDPSRQKRIQQLIKKNFLNFNGEYHYYCHNVDGWSDLFDKLSKTEFNNDSISIKNTISKIILEDIENERVSNIEIENIIAKSEKVKIDLIKFDDTYDKLNEKIIVLEQQKKKIQSSYFKELFLRKEINELQKVIDDLTKQKTNVNFDTSAYIDIINNLIETISKLQKELEDLKRNRTGKETEYAIYYLYSKLDADYLLKCKESNANASIQFVKINNNESDGIRPLINAIIDGFDDIDLYIDVQGGNRTDGYVRNAVLSILSNECNNRINVCQVIATNFENGKLSHQIVDETNRYRISDLVSGMNAFVNYGKINILKNYFKSNALNECQNNLLSAMVKLDNALSLSASETIVESINDIRNCIDALKINESDQSNPYFDILIDGIVRDYGKMLDNDSTIFDIIEWATKKGYIQQALTIYVERLPFYYFDHIKIFGLPDVERFDIEDKMADKMSNFYKYYKKDKPTSFNLDKSTELINRITSRLIEIRKRKYANINAKSVSQVFNLLIGDELGLTCEAGLKDSFTHTIKNEFNVSKSITLCRRQNNLYKRELSQPYENVDGFTSALNDIFDKLLGDGFLKSIVNFSITQAPKGTTNSAVKTKTNRAKIIASIDTPKARGVLLYYLTLKIMRNHVNHANDSEDSNTEEEEIIRIFMKNFPNGVVANMANNNPIMKSIPIGYTTIELILKEAIETNKQCISHNSIEK